jgi:ABC-2 type transport system permease protein
MSSISNVNPTGDFAAIKPNVAIINNDSNTALIDCFINYVSEKTNIINIDTDDEKMKDALFFRKVDFILIIPENFTSDFMKNLKPEIKTMQVPDSYAYTYLSSAFNKFFSIANMYVESKMDQKLIVDNLRLDLKETVDVEIPSTEKTSKLEQAQYYYNFSNYTLIAICVHIVAMIMNSFRNIRIKRRNIISGTPYRKITNSLFLSNICVMFSIWLIYIVISLFLYGMAMLEPRGILMILNSLIFMITILSLGFFIGNLVNNRNAIDGIVNVLALGSSFICGAFVPQQYLGTFVLSIAKIFSFILVH